MAPQHRRCCVPSCNVTGADNVVLHNFPNPGSMKYPEELERFRIWIMRIGGDIVGEDNMYIFRHRFVCHRHFEDIYMYPTQRLNRLAIPTLHIPGDRAPGVYVNPKPKDTPIPAPNIDLVPKLSEETHTVHSHIFDSLAAIDDVLTDVVPDDAVTADDPSPVPVPVAADPAETELFSWQKTELIEADDPEEPPPPADPTLALYCDPDPDPAPDQTVPSEPALAEKDDENRCKDCGEVNEGFEFWCVQCSCGALCGACAGRAPHHAHYVLRAPMGCIRTRTQAVLALIRQQLQNQNLLSQHETVDDGLKVEVKEEPGEEPSAAAAPLAPAPALATAETDPLACEPHSPEPRATPELRATPEPCVTPGSRASPELRTTPEPRPTSIPHSPEPRATSKPHSPEPRATPEPCVTPGPRATPEPHTTPEPRGTPEPLAAPEPAARQEQCGAEQIIDRRVHHEQLKLSRLPEALAHKANLPLSQRKLVKLSPAQVKLALVSHLKRIVTTQQQSKPQPTPQILNENLKLRNKGREYQGPKNKSQTAENFTGTQHNPVRPQPKVTSEHKPSEIVIIDLDEDETVEYLEEGLESDIEAEEEVVIDDNETTIDERNTNEDDNGLDDRETNEDGDIIHDYDDDDVLDEDYLVDEDDLTENDESDEDIIGNVARNSTKRRVDAKQTSAVRGLSGSMIRDDDASDKNPIVSVAGRAVKRRNNSEEISLRHPSESIIREDLIEDDLSDEDAIVNVAGRGVKRKKDAEETSPVKGPYDSMARALPSKAVVQVRPLSSLEIRNWTADRKRLRKD